MKSLLTVATLVAVSLSPLGGQEKTTNVILVSMDGFRWEELFGGAVDSLMNDLTYVKDFDTTYLQENYGGESPGERRQKLMPWMWSIVAEQGQIYGNQWLGNKVRCSNSHWFSYPGYNELLVGFSDPNITSNAKTYNENVTVLEWLNNQPQLQGKVAAFASWDVFPYIINDVRSGIPVNAGFRKASGPDLSEKEKILNQLIDEIPSPWSSVRLDAFTHHYMMEYLRKEHPRLVYIAYGETDDFAHDGEYDHYLQSAHQTDKWLRQLWSYLQEDDFYRDQTTMIITTDHGRGSSPKAEWQSHGKTYEGSPFIWIAIIGPDTAPLGEIDIDERLFQNQVAKTMARLLGYDYYNERGEVGPVVERMIRH